VGEPPRGQLSEIRPIARYNFAYLIDARPSDAGHFGDGWPTLLATSGPRPCCGYAQNHWRSYPGAPSWARSRQLRAWLLANSLLCWMHHSPWRCRDRRAEKTQRSERRLLTLLAPSDTGDLASRNPRGAMIKPNIEALGWKSEFYCSALASGTDWKQAGLTLWPRRLAGAVAGPLRRPGRIGEVEAATGPRLFRRLRWSSSSMRRS
jgi:hypothetical protein